MKLSIITINRNDAAGLARTLRSTFEEQPGFDDWEQIVVDGDSSDGSFAEVSHYRENPHLGWSVSEPDGGIYDAMNKGASHACGDYLLFLNAGDVLVPGALAEVFKNNPDGDILYGAAIYVRTDGTKFLRKLPPPNQIHPAFFLFTAFPHQACFISRQLHNEIGGYDTALKIVADTKFFIQAIGNGSTRLQQVPVTVCCFEIGGVSSDLAHAEKHWKEREKMLAPFFGAFIANESVKLRKGKAPWIRQDIIYAAAADHALAVALNQLTDIATAAWQYGMTRFLLKAVLFVAKAIRRFIVLFSFSKKA